MSNRKKTIIITGASSGLGRSIALEYALSGHRLFLFGRSATRLKEISDLCIKKGAMANYVSVCVTDESKMKESLKNIIEEHPVDILISCAGVSAGSLNGPEKFDQVNKIFATNINGVLNSVVPVIPHMIEKKSGNIVIIGSMAGLLGLSSSPSYSASKGGIMLFSEAIRSYLRPNNVYVSTVIPGYIDTPMTRVNKFPMPFMMSPEKASNKIIRAVNKNKPLIIFPYAMYLLIKLFKLLPYSIYSYINSKLPGKPSF